MNTPQATTCFACGQSLTTGTAPQLTLRQRYRTLHQLGQGGMGAVYKAEDTELGNRLVAIKEMSLRGLSQQEADEATQNFKREALLLAGLMHPNLPSIYDHFAENGRWYLVMDFIEGETLEDYQEKFPGAKLPVWEALEIGIQLCIVLDYLHTRQPAIIFRDLKPANILRTSSGHLYLIDFGIARHFKPGQAKDTIAFGSPGYAAPEQYGKTQTTPRSDLYSLGAILHQMISGNDPSLTPFFFAPLNTGPAALQTLLQQMLDMDANKRPSSAQEVKQALQQLATQTTLQPSQPLAAPPAYGIVSSPPGSAASPRLPRPLQPAQRGLMNPGKLAFSYSQADWISSIAWSPSGNKVASASYDGTVQVRDAHAGNILQTVTHNKAFWRQNRIYALAWSPQERHFATVGEKKMLVWDALTGSTIYSPQSQIDAHTIAWSPDGNLLATGNGSEVVVMVAMSGRFAFNYGDHLGPLQAIGWSPDSTLIAVSSWGSTVLIFDARLEADHHQRKKMLYQGHAGPVNAVAWSPNSTLIASASEDATVQIWEPLSGQALLTYYGHVKGVKALTWSPDGTLIASAGLDGTIQIWSAQTGDHIFTYRGHSGAAFAVAWSPDGMHLASGGEDQVVHVWQAV
ncbi:MAG: serine/threonine protein kinase [Chloroflexi bacterium]|nr:serine/threonine protein kinase [Chloroflexota bacterium]